MFMLIIAICLLILSFQADQPKGKSGKSQAAPIVQKAPASGNGKPQRFTGN